MWRTCSSAADSTGCRLPEDSRLNRALAVAVKDGNIDECSHLLDDGASPEAGYISGYTALGLAANRGHDEIAALLLNRGANPDMPICANDVTPLIVAVVWSRTTIVKLLLAHRCCLDTRGTAGSYREKTAIDVARARPSQDILDLLVRERATRRLRRVARLAPAVGRFGLALLEVYFHVHFRPGADGAREAQDEFEGCAAIIGRSPSALAGDIGDAITADAITGDAITAILPIALMNSHSPPPVPPPCLSTLPRDEIYMILLAVLDDPGAVDEDYAAVCVCGARAVARVSISCKSLHGAVFALVHEGNALCRRRDAVCASLRPFELLRRKGAEAPAPLPTRALPSICTLEHYAICETLAQWGGNQISLSYPNSTPFTEDYIESVARLCWRHPRARVRIESHAGHDARLASRASDDALRESQSEASCTLATLTRLLTAREHDTRRLPAVTCTPWGSRFTAPLGYSMGNGSEIYFELDGLELPPRPLCHDQAGRPKPLPPLSPQPQRRRSGSARGPGTPGAGCQSTWLASAPHNRPTSTAASRAWDRTLQPYAPARRRRPFESSVL